MSGPAPSVPRLVVDARVRVPFDRAPERDLQADAVDRYDELLGVRETAVKSTADLLGEMDAAGVTHAIVHAEYEHGDRADALNDAVAGLVSDHPDRFAGFGTVSLEPLRISRALKQVDRVVELGLRGLNLEPVFFGIALDDRRLYPVYAKAEEAGLVVGVHSGVNYARGTAIRHERPELIDQIAADFPELKLIACHGGWPWVTELVAVMRRHETVYADFGGLAPKYIGRTGTGWEVMAQYIRSGLLAGQALYATDWPVFPVERAVWEWGEIGLSEDVHARVMGGNAAELIGLRRS